MSNVFYIANHSTGSNTGVDYANAYQTAQLFWDNVTSSDVGFANSTINGPELLTVTIDADTNSGTITSQLVIYGVNGNQSLDPMDDIGTECEFSGDNTATNCMLVSGIDYCSWYDLSFTLATGDGLSFAGSTNVDAWYLKGIRCDNNGGIGMYGGPKLLNSYLEQCSFNNNSSMGQRYIGNNCHMFACEIIGNASIGMQDNSATIYGSRIDCIYHDNGNDGYRMDDGILVRGCVFDSNSSEGILCSGVTTKSIFHNRFTNNGGWAIDGTGDGVIAGSNAFRNNTLGNYSNSTNITQVGGGLLLTADGYEDAASDNFSLNDDSEGRRIAITIGAS